MNYVASILFAILFCLVVLTEVANCDPKAAADPFFFGRGFGGFGGGRGGSGPADRKERVVGNFQLQGIDV